MAQITINNPGPITITFKDAALAKMLGKRVLRKLVLRAEAPLQKVKPGRKDKRGRKKATKIPSSPAAGKTGKPGRRGRNKLMVKDVILKLLSKKKIVRPVAIIAKAGCSGQAVLVALKGLMKAKIVKKVGRGEYALAGGGAQVGAGQKASKNTRKGHGRPKKVSAAGKGRKKGARGRPRKIVGRNARKTASPSKTSSPAPLKSVKAKAKKARTGDSRKNRQPRVKNQTPVEKPAEIPAVKVDDAKAEVKEGTEGGV